MRGPGAGRGTRRVCGSGPGRTGICLLLGLLALSGCGRYADFSLPPVSGGDPNMTFAFEAQAEPVLSPGDGWDSHDVLNPSVISRPLAPTRKPSGYPRAVAPGPCFYTPASTGTRGAQGKLSPATVFTG